MKVSENKILFYGEIGCSVHGISISNMVNVGMLKSIGEVDVIEENARLTDHNKLSLFKLFLIFRNILRIISKTRSTRYRYFYLVYSLSFFGGIKSFLAIIFYRVFSKGEVILHIHRGDFFTRFYKSRFNKVLTNLVFRLSNKIIVLSENQKNEFESAFRRPFLVLHNTIESEPVLDPPEKKKYTFIYLSNYLEDKGIIDLLEAFTRVADVYKDISLETYGHFPDMKLQQRILKYNSSQVSINGPIYGHKKLEVLSQAGCLILPSWSEGQPLIILESMFVGTPVIASSVGLIPELLGQNYPFLSRPNDIKSLEDVIIRFLNFKNTDEVALVLNKKYHDLYSNDYHYAELVKIFS